MIQESICLVIGFTFELFTFVITFLSLLKNNLQRRSFFPETAQKLTRIYKVMELL
jgi:hypothetical protein